MSQSKTAFGIILLQLALASILVVAGLSAFLEGSRDAMMSAVASIFANSDVRTVLVYTIAVLEIIAGAFLLLDLFSVKALEKLGSVVLVVIMVIWIVVIVLVDLLPLFRGSVHFLSWLDRLAQHLLVLAAMVVVKSGDR